MLPTEWLPLCGTVFVLGLRHGLDADHLAAIDGLTRYNSESSPRLSRWCGVLFALGHGGVVMLVAGIVGSAAVAYPMPAWLDGAGTWISITFLVALGVLNLRTVLKTPPDEMVRLSGLRSTLLLPLARTYRPLGIAAIGALFAISFDSLSQAVLFSATAAHFGGASSALALGALFVLGMATVDGLNSNWIAALLRRQDQRARTVSRVLGLCVAALSFAVAALGAARYFNESVDAAVGAYETPLGVAIVLLAVAVIFIVGRSAAKRNHGAVLKAADRLSQV